VSIQYPPKRLLRGFRSQLKKDYLKGVGDTFDLVVVGGYYGKGKRTSVYGAFLLACYDPDSEKFQTVCKLGTGFSEEALKSNMETLKELEMSKCRSDIDGGGAKPDVWFEPKAVWEILAADLSLSPVYAAAKGAVRILFFTLLLRCLPRLRSPTSGAEMFRFRCLFAHAPSILPKLSGRRSGNIPSVS
jgi:DNA ligase 1